MPGILRLYKTFKFIKSEFIAEEDGAAYSPFSCAWL